MRYVVGVDVGGTNLVAGVLAEDGSEIHGVVSEPTMAAQGADAVTARIVKLAKASIAESGKKIEGVGIGSPGPLNTKTGVVLLTPFPQPSITTPTARSSVNGGAAPRAARSTSSVSRSARGLAAASSSTVRSTTA